jgi:ABC-2 type transport system permease protein
MISTLVRKEFTELLRDGRFRWSAGIVLALLAIAVLAGVRHQRELVAQQRAAQAEELHRWYHQPDKNPHSGAHYGFYVFKPRLAPGFIDPGVEPYTGIGTWLEAHYQNEMVFRPAADATLAQRFGDLTVALALQVMLPLVVVLLAFNAFAGERERGTLRQLLSLGLRPRDLVLGKMLGVLGALAVVVVPALALGSLALALTEAGAAAGRFGVMAFAYVIYLGIFVFVALAVSSRAPSSRFALVALLGFWAANCLFAPRAIGDVAALVHPLPDPVVMRANIKNGIGDPHGAPAKLQQRVAALMQEHGVSRPEDLPINVRGLQLQMGEEHAYEIYDRHLGELNAAMLAQERLRQLGAALFPLVGLQSLSTALAGTDLRQHLDFMSAAESHRRVIQKLMNDAVMMRPLKPGEVYIAGREMWAKVPPFAHEPASLGTVLARNAVPLGVLLAWLAAALWFAARSARHLRAL